MLRGSKGLQGLQGLQAVWGRGLSALPRLLADQVRYQEVTFGLGSGQPGGHG